MILYDKVEQHWVCCVAMCLWQITHNQQNVLDLSWLEEGAELAHEELESMAHNMGSSLRQLIDQRDKASEVLRHKYKNHSQSDNVTMWYQWCDNNHSNSSIIKVYLYTHLYTHLFICSKCPLNFHFDTLIDMEKWTGLLCTNVFLSRIVI